MDTTEKIEYVQDSMMTELESRPTAEEVNILLEIKGLETSKRMLYDQNAIVRTTIRPDDRMNEYDQKIKALREKLKSK